MSSGENPGCYPLHHWHCPVSLYGGCAGTNKQITTKINNNNYQKDKKLSITKKMKQTRQTTHYIALLAYMAGVQV